MSPSPWWSGRRPSPRQGLAAASILLAVLVVPGVMAATNNTNMSYSLNGGGDEWAFAITPSVVEGWWYTLRFPPGPQVNLSPANGTNVTTTALLSVFAVSNASTDVVCNLSVNGTLNISDDTLQNSTTETYNLTLTDGNYTWAVTCCDWWGRCATTPGTFTVSAGVALVEWPLAAVLLLVGPGPAILVRRWRRRRAPT